jgi:hypothetical protein
MLSDRPAESVTVSLKLIVVSACKFDGAVKLDVAWLALLSWTGGPLICVHANVIGLPSGSWLALPSSVTSELSLTVWSGPTTAIGAVSVGGFESFDIFIHLIYYYVTYFSGLILLLLYLLQLLCIE